MYSLSSGMTPPSPCNQLQHDGADIVSGLSLQRVDVVGAAGGSPSVKGKKY